MNIPTAENIIENIDSEFYKENSYYLSNTMPIEFARIVAIKFAKLHVMAALIEANKNWEFKDYCDTHGAYIKKDSILSAYSLDNIK